MSDFGWTSKPLRVGVVTDACSECPRKFEIEVYDPKDLERADNSMSALKKNHDRMNHQKEESK